MLLEAVSDSDLEHGVRELAAATVVHVITPKDGNVEAPLRSAEDVIQLRLALAKIVAEGGEGAPAFRERFAEDYGRLDEELKLLRQAFGDEIVDWLDSRWGSLLKAVYAKKKIAMFVDDEEVGTFLYDEGLRFGTLYPITEKSLAGRVKQGQPFVDHLARKRDQDKRKITSVGRRLHPMSRVDAGARRSAASRRRCWTWPSASLRGGQPPDPEVTRRGARGGAAARLASRRRGCAPRSRPVIMCKRSLGAGLQWMHDAGVLAVLLPELEATVDFSQEAGRRHKDVWEHTKQVVLQSVPEPDRALGGAAARHRQGADARHAARREGHLSPPRRGRARGCGSRSRSGWASTSRSARRSAS